MSVEHQPSSSSHENLGGNNNNIINNRKLTSSATAIIDKNRNMVLSAAIPLESGHLMIQQQQSSSNLPPRITTLTTNSQQQNNTITSSNGTTILSSNGNYTQIHRNNNISPSKIITTSTSTTIGGHLQQLSASTNNHTVTKIISSNNNNNGLTTASKYVIFQPNTHYTTNTNTNEPFLTTTNTNGGQQSNGVGNIVIVATEPMDMQQQQHQTTGINGNSTTTILNNSSNGGNTIGVSPDEDLTSLTWLTDKNLIKSLVACTNKTKLTTTTSTTGNSNNYRQINTNNGCVVVSSGGNGKSSLSPNNDYIEDCNMSDETTATAVTSINSSPIDLGGGNNSIRFSTNEYQHKHHNIQFTNKNRNHIITPITGTTNSFLSNTKTINSTILQSDLHQQQQHHPHQHQHSHHLNSNLAAALGGATTTLHVGPSGTTTVVEYKTTSNFIPTTATVTSAIRHIPNQQQVPPHSSTTTRSSPITLNNCTVVGSISSLQQQKHINNTNTNSLNPLTTVVLTTAAATSPVLSSSIPKSPQHQPLQTFALTTKTPNPSSCSSSSSSNLSILVPQISTTTTATTTATTTHHPHKKYLREQMNGLDQQQNINNSISSNNIYNNNGITTNNFTTMSSPNIITYNNNNNNNNNGGGSGSCSGSGSGISTTSSQISNQSIYAISESPPRDYQQQHHSTPIKSTTASTPASQISYSEYDNDSLKDYEVPNGATSSSSSSSINGRSSSKQQQQTSSSSGALSPSKQKHPTNVPYDPLVHTNSKPPYSFSSLIFMAIEDSPEKALPVKEIYAWIVFHFPYFKTAPTGWKNSVRHNLSLNKSFLKVEKAPNMGKGSLWRVEQLQRPNLLQALARSPFHPCSAVEQKQSCNDKNLSPSSYKSSNGGGINNGGGTGSGLDTPPGTPVKSTLDARLFPKLSKMMKELITKGGAVTSVATTLNDVTDDTECQSNFLPINNNNSDSAEYSAINGNGIKSSQHYDNVENNLGRDCCADSIDDVNAATAMLALKHGPKVFTETFNNGSPVITNSPSDDHTYSAGGGSSAAVSSSCSSSSSGGGSHGSHGIGTLIGTVGIGNIVIVGGGGGGGSSNGICSSSSNSSVLGQNGSDNLSNGGSSDAAYESSEECHNITAEELEEQRRVEGVDALLSLSSMFDITSTLPSPIKRPSSFSVEQEHISSYMENIPNLNGKGILAANGTIDEGYNTPASYYSHLLTPITGTTLTAAVSSSSSPVVVPIMSSSKLHCSTTNLLASSNVLPKKFKQSRGIRAKIKRKTAWIR